MTVYIVTTNKGKFKEYKDFIPDVKQLKLDIPEIQDIDPVKVTEAKLKEAMKHQAGSLIVDDVAVELGCLGGLPGPFIKYFHEIGNERMFEITQKLGDDKATVIGTIGYTDGKIIKLFEGRVKGRIVAPRSGGFGWDPIFQPDGFDKTYGEMAIEEKNKYSHRGLALRKLRDYLE